MNQIQQLINQMCPNGVEWVNIGDVSYISDYVSAGSFASLRENVTYRTEPDYAVLVRIADFSSNFDESKFIYIDQHAYNFLSKSNLQPGDIIMSNVGSCGLTFRCPDLNKKMSLAPNAIVIRTSNNSYFYHWLTSKKGQSDIQRITTKSAMPKFNKTQFKQLQLPLPPLAIQTRIVEILDHFTNLTANLTAELNLRRKQFEHYREKLLSHDGVEGVEWKKLGEVGKVCMCKRIMKYQTTELGDIPFYKIGTFGNKPDAYISKELFEEYKTKYSFPRKGEILISAAGTIGKTVVYDGQPAYYQDSNIVWLANDESKVLNPYLAYCYQMSPWKVSGGGTIARLYNENIANAEIPVPPLATQHSIVSILDKFTALIENIEKELALRQKQYEYYREELLRFGG